MSFHRCPSPYLLKILLRVLACGVLSVAGYLAAQSSLVAHYNFDEETEFTASIGDLISDVSGNGNDGTEGSDIMWNADGVGGGAITTTAATGGPHFTATFGPGLIAGDSFTISFWVRTGATGTGDNYKDWGRLDFSDGVDTEHVQLRSLPVAAASGNGGFYFRDPTSAWFKINETVNLKDNEWHMVTAVADGTDLTLYIDGGNPVTFDDYPRAAGFSLVGLRIGNGNDTNVGAIGTVSLAGLLDDVRLYDGPLSAAEVAALHTPTAFGNGQSSLFSGTLVADMLVKQGSGDLTLATGADLGTTILRHEGGTLALPGGAVLGGSIELAVPAANCQITTGTAGIEYLLVGGGGGGDTGQSGVSYGAGGAGGISYPIGTQGGPTFGGIGGGGAYTEAGAANTGGGGGAAADGGSGIVIIRYPGAPAATGGTISAGTGASEGHTLHTFADVGESTFQLTGASFTGILAGPISGSGGFTFPGFGSLTLGGANTYSGDTLVPNGTLALASGGQLTFVIGGDGVNNQLAGGGSGSIDGTFQLDLAAADATAGNSWQLVNLGSVTYGGAFAVTGTAGVFSRSGTTHTLSSGGSTWTFEETTGLLSVSDSSGGGEFASWIGGYFPGESDPAIIGADADANGDGVANALVYLLGGDPKDGDNLALLPTAALVADPGGSVPDGDYFVLSFRRVTTAQATATVEHSTTLAAPWTAATAGIDGVVVVETADGFSPGIDKVEVFIPCGGNPRLFSRLVVRVP